MNSSALLEETTQLEMDNPRKEQEELNLNELNSFLNSIMNKCRSKFFYFRQMQMLIGNTADAMTEAGDGAGGEKPDHRQLQDHVAPRLDQHQQRLVPKESANS